MNLLGLSIGSEKRRSKNQRPLASFHPGTILGPELRQPFVMRGTRPREALGQFARVGELQELGFPSELGLVGRVGRVGRLGE